MKTRTLFSGLRSGLLLAAAGSQAFAMTDAGFDRWIASIQRDSIKSAEASQKTAEPPIDSVMPPGSEITMYASTETLHAESRGEAIAKVITLHHMKGPGAVISSSTGNLSPEELAQGLKGAREAAYAASAAAGPGYIIVDQGEPRLSPEALYELNRLQQMDVTVVFISYPK